MSDTIASSGDVKTVMSDQAAVVPFTGAPSILVDGIQGFIFVGGNVKFNFTSATFNPNGGLPNLEIALRLAMPLPVVYQFRDAITDMLRQLEDANAPAIAAANGHVPNTIKE